MTSDLHFGQRHSFGLFALCFIPKLPVSLSAKLIKPAPFIVARLPRLVVGALNLLAEIH